MKPGVLAVSNHDYRERVRPLLAALPFQTEFLERDKATSKRAMASLVWDRIRTRHWDLVYMEGTGIALGAPLILASRKWRQPYIVSSGDPVGGFFRTTRGPLLGSAMEIYERQLYRHSVGFIGWTPYLSDMALQMGAPRAITVEGGADLKSFRPLSGNARREARSKLGLPEDALVCGVVGSLVWTERQQYCYGLELVETLRYLRRDDVYMLIVGDGNGRSLLERRIPAELRARVRFTGRLEAQELTSAVNAMDVGFVSQTLDGLGSYRLTTKLPEYFACGVPVAMSPTRGFHDYVSTAGWALPAEHPASETFHRGCAAWLDTLSREEVAAKASRARPVAEQRFDYSVLASRFAGFVEDILRGGSGPIRPPAVKRGT